jgi:hypothetical protein
MTSLKVIEAKPYRKAITTMNTTLSKNRATSLSVDLRAK